MLLSSKFFGISLLLSYQNWSSTPTKVLPPLMLLSSRSKKPLLVGFAGRWESHSNCTKLPLGRKAEINALLEIFLAYERCLA